jgi:DNA-binding NtrC family response regulator
VRVLAATHRDLASMVADGSFREDLFYRLKGAAIELPPLRDRGDDVLALADHLLARLAARLAPGTPPPRLAPAAAARLLSHRWPGNVRELENVLAVAAALAAADGGAIEPEHLDLPGSGGEADGDGDAPTAYHARVDALRRRLVAEALAAAGGMQAEAARRLGLSRQAMGYLVKRLGIS